MARSRGGICFVAVTELKKRLRHYVVRVEKGKQFIITKRGQLVALLEPIDLVRLGRLRAELAEFSERRRGKKRVMIRTPYPSLEKIVRELGVPRRRVSQLKKIVDTIVNKDRSHR